MIQITGAQVAAAVVAAGEPDAEIAGDGFEEALGVGAVALESALPEHHRCEVVRDQLAAALLVGLMVGLEIRDA